MNAKQKLIFLTSTDASLQ